MEDFDKRDTKAAKLIVIFIFAYDLIILFITTVSAIKGIVDIIRVVEKTNFYKI